MEGFSDQQLVGLSGVFSHLGSSAIPLSPGNLSSPFHPFLRFYHVRSGRTMEHLGSLE